MATTYSASYSNVTLTNPTLNPVYVTGTITGTASALQGASPTAWTITNSGTIAGGTSASTAGIQLAAGGSVTNQASGTISGYAGVAIYGAAGTVTNAGTIAASAAYAVRLAAGYANLVVVDPGAVFTGTVSGGNTLGSTSTSTLELASGASAGTLTGFGAKYIDFTALTIDTGADWTLAGYNVLNTVQLVVSGATTLDVTGTLVGAVTLQNGAYLSVAAGATVKGSGVGAAYGYPGTNTVVNAGLIDPGFAGVYLGGSGGAVTNLASGTIIGTTYGAFANGGTIVNSGSIGGGSSGLLLREGASAFNHSNGTITGGVRGVYGRFTPGTLTNAGTISGGTDAVLFAAGYTGRLVVDPGAMFIGTVSGGNTLGSTIISTLELASGATTGTLNSFGSQYIDFAQVTIDPSASWLVNSSDVVTTSYTIIDGGTLTNTGSLGSGVTMGNAAVLTNVAGATISAPLAVSGAVGNVATVINAGSIASTSTAAYGGIFLNGGGYVSNASGGTITGPNGVFLNVTSSTLVNAGTLAGSGFAGAFIYQGVVANQAGGVITGPSIGLDVGSAPATVVNYGTIAGTGGSGFGIDLTHGGTIVNQSGGTIASPSFDAVTIASGFAVIDNAGTILSDNGIFLSGAATGISLTNQSGGVIASTVADLSLNAGSDTVVNAGTMLSSFVSAIAPVIYMHGAGTLSNLAGAEILTHAKAVVAGRGNMTIANAGTIAGIYAVQFRAGYDGDRLIAAPGAVFNGTVDGGNAAGSTHVSMLELASGATAGTLGGLGSNYLHFANVAIDSGATWTLTSAFIGAGYAIYDGGTLTNTGSLGSAVTLGAGAQLTNAPGAIVYASSVAVTGAASSQVVNGGTIAGVGGVEVGAGSTVTNAVGALITAGAMNGVEIIGGGSLFNAGSIGNAGSDFSAVYFHGSGTLYNAATGTITSTYHDIDVFGGSGTVVNLGLLASSNTAYSAIALDNGGTISNAAGGTILAAYHDIYIKGGGTVFNAGMIAATGAHTISVGLLAGADNRVIIAPGASFIGKIDGGNTLGATATSTLELAPGTSAGTLAGFGAQYIHFGGISVDAGAYWVLTADTIGAGYAIADSGTLTNTGSLGSPVTLGAGANLTNAAGATIASTGPYGVYVPAGGSVTNVGVIAGASDAVKFSPGAGDLLVVAPGAVFTGKLDGGNAVTSGVASTLELLSGASAGTLAGLGTQIVNFTSIVIDAAAVWTLSSATLGAGYAIYDLGTLTNQGSLQSSVLTHGGLFSNAASSVVDVLGGPAAVYAIVSAATVTNAGTISDNSTKSDGVKLVQGGFVTNLTGGTISAAYSAIGIYGKAGIVSNAGLIVGVGINSDAVFLGEGLVINQAGGIISDSFTSIYGAVEANGVVTVVNAGTISGATYAVSFYSGHADKVVVDPGAVFIGTVTGGNIIGATASSYLELASAATTGTLDGLGTQFIDFAQVTLDAGASWLLSNATVAAGATLTALAGSQLSDAGTLANFGAVVLDPSTAVIGGLIGNGSATIASGSTLDLQAALAVGGTIDFSGSGELLLGTPTLVGGQLGNFAVGDTIDLAGIDPASVGYTSGNLTFSGGSILLNLASGGTPVAAPDGAGGALVTLCFREGTRIATMSGQIAVEHLAIGNRVQALGGWQPATWIGRRHIDCTRHPKPHLVWPVRVMRGAFGDGVPHRDLWLSPDHAVFVNGALIPVKYLINGATIAQVRVADVTYFHVELPRHDVLLAEGLPVESYLETGDRANFDNGGAPLRLHPDFATRTWEARGCAPIVVSGPALDAARTLLTPRSAA